VGDPPAFAIVFDTVGFAGECEKSEPPKRLETDEMCDLGDEKSSTLSPKQSEASSITAIIHQQQYA
jgi:hypothetical protein